MEHEGTRDNGAGREDAFAAARALLDELESSASSSADELDVVDWLTFRARIGDAIHQFNDAAKAIDRALGLPSATSRLRAYLLANIGQIVANDELAGVAGVHEWARRLRELELEEGWSIVAGPEGGLRVGTYRLEAETVDQAKAEAWRTRNGIRRREGSGSARLLAYLQAIYPRVASKEDLAYVSRINEWPRRVRELAEAGWDVISSSDDPTLPAGSYRLGQLEQGPARSRQAIKRRAEILARDDWTCADCGASPRTTPGTRLQIHHLHEVQHGGDNADENLLTLCHPCHAGRHSMNGPAEALVRDELLEPGADPWR